MTTNKQNIKEKIINAAIKLIESQGNMNISIRDIIKIAEVNIAAINYYFGTKESLFRQVENKVLEFLHKIFQILEDTKLDLKERIYQWIRNLLYQFLHYPAYFHIFSQKMCIFESIDDKQDGIINASINKIINLIQKLRGNLNEKEYNCIILFLNSSIMFPVLFLHTSKRIFALDFRDEKFINEYAQTVLNQLLTT